MTRPIARRAAFTLVEMLVVIFIIAALAAMLLVGINAAIKASHNYAMKMEVSQLAQAVEAYKQDKGDYFPSLSEAYASPGNTVAYRHILRCYPKIRSSPPNTNPKDEFFKLIEQDNPSSAEAMVMFLSMTCSDLQDPFLGNTDFKLYFPFDERRLVKRVGSKHLMTNRNLTYYSYKPKYAKDTYYYYFDPRTSAVFDLQPNPTVPIPGNPNPPSNPKPYGKAGTSEFINGTTFQIICAGLDGDFGSQATPARKVIPYGGSGGTHNLGEGDADNITNFGDGKLLKDLLD